MDEEEGREEESVLKERSAVVEGGSGSSWSWVGIGVGFVEVNADKGSEPMLRTMWFLLVIVNVVASSRSSQVIDHRKETRLGGKERSLSEIKGFGMIG